MPVKIAGDLLRSLGPSYFNAPLYLGAALEQTGQIFFFNSSSALATGFQSGNTSAALTYTLPTAGPAGNDYSLVSSTVGVLSWLDLGAGAGFMDVQAVSTTPISGATGKTYLVDTSTLAITINLPSPAVDTFLMVKDVTGNAEINNITLNRSGSELIDGVAANKVLTLPNVFCLIVSDGTNWFVLLEI